MPQRKATATTCLAGDAVVARCAAQEEFSLISSCAADLSIAAATPINFASSMRQKMCAFPLARFSRCLNIGSHDLKNSFLLQMASKTFLENEYQEDDDFANVI